MKPNSLERIEMKIDKLDSHLSMIDVTLAKQHEQLVYHIRRTDVLEESVKPLSAVLVFSTILLKIVAVAALLSGIYKAFA